MVYSTAMRLLGKPAEAEDVAQEVFLRAFERFAVLKESPTAGGWLKTVTTNLCLNHLSRYRSRWTFFSDLKPTQEDGEDAMLDLPAEEETTTYLEAQDTRQLLETALQRLPSSQRVPLVLYHFEERSYEEIAALLKISMAKVKTDIFRAREALRRILKMDVERQELVPTAGRAQKTPKTPISSLPGTHLLSQLSLTF